MGGKNLKFVAKNFTRYSRVTNEKQKKSSHLFFCSSFETYTRYSTVADKEWKKDLGFF